jgi:hypothetical protein
VEVDVTKRWKTKAPRSAEEVSTLEDFLRDEGKLVEFETVASEEVLACQDPSAPKARPSVRKE